jgi:hypothetical protein
MSLGAFLELGIARLRGGVAEPRRHAVRKS